MDSSPVPDLIGKTVAVLTGDVVHSTRMTGKARRRLHDALYSTSGELREHFCGLVPYDVDIYRGDSWQLLVSAPHKALRVALYFRSRLRSHFESDKVDTRVAIGVGSVDFLPEKGVSTGDGDAFRRSGWAFEELGRTGRMAFSGDGPHARCLDVAVELVDFPASHWTARQAYAVSQALLELTQEDIADGWIERAITQQAVAQHLSRAGWHAVDTALSFFEDVLAM